ncbi:uncharacterized protein F5Z01DRAFT_669330 [Emericellopsis atlantica]|uniref:Uncharacterized protein n=1 Tax=Emericellopsis atlantica TaxID=2614577 RepID=A0A9P7ZCI5_9HYPO|nr:uncharacterized protein F5Z01DRAFT_669330 [Emericellopsis atlantica]KAG9249386.1 hypothetical protein F5Z01DRAFT_669330 [Emericellopsis atlantica]
MNIVKTHLQKCQPYYAVPSQFHLLDELPVTSNGKINKQLLKESISDTRPLVVEKASSTADLPLPPSLQKAISDTADTTLCNRSNSSFVDEKPDLDWEAAVPDKREAVGHATAVNLTIAVLIRQELVINAIYTVACSVPKSWPLWIRRRAARVFHLGGVHSGAGVSAALWMFANTTGDTACMTLGTCGGHWGKPSVAVKVITWIIAALFVAMMAMAYPTVRKAHHNRFEVVHRFVGWTVLGLFWAQVVLTANDTKATDVSLGTAAVRTPALWLLVVATLSVASSWFWLRKVSVRAEALSKHAVRLLFDYTVPVNGSFTRLSHTPLLEWHSFATIPAPEAVDGKPKGYSLVVSNAGDWTRAMIEQPRPYIWVRGVPTCGVMRIATLFNRLVIVATGSGIGPQLGHILSPSCPTKLIWSTKDPENTFGKSMCQLLKSKCPDAVIWDTRTQGRPDLVCCANGASKE